MYPDQWVVVEGTRVNRGNQPLSARVLAHAREKAEIKRGAIKAADERPEASRWTFYTGARIPEGVILHPSF
jgi:hypothetical protein